ncbi:MAG: Unknown protein [uncultured Thiotrichaceae bacterium]|uniref:Uncharacterized protein n=1 Tax=uncultured Thiotrichaceae bacterium TaxID=298394 RepID=A0A6S6U4N3_9GAMM|nr:MAG: Unknown protein [uncultured Thiotrichaceae bacterium]
MAAAATAGAAGTGTLSASMQASLDTIINSQNETVAFNEGLTTNKQQFDAQMSALEGENAASQAAKSLASSISRQVGQ